MEIYLDNIGLIQDSTVKLDGLTVIAGENNSGKSTVGKALYAVMDGIIGIDAKQERDEFNYCRTSLMDTLHTSIRNMHRLHFFEDEQEFFVKAKSIQGSGVFIDEFLSSDFFVPRSKGELLAFIEGLMDELHPYELPQDVLIHLSHNRSDSQKTPNETFQQIKTEALELSEKIRKILQNGTPKDAYRLKYMQYTLSNEFKGEIQPVRNKNLMSKIALKDAQGLLFECDIEENLMMYETFKFVLSGVNTVFFVDNAFVLDEVKSRPFWRSRRHVDDESIVDTSLILTHKEKLVSYLSNFRNHNIIHELDVVEKYNDVKKKIASILPGDFIHTPQGLKYEHEGVSLKAVNLATGSKMFAIIKMILDRYAFDEGTLLILDEPEAHLHPKWQNAFTEVIVLLVKELGVRVLLTSHSTHFVLALDAHMRQYDIIEKTNFYKTHVLDDGFVKYECVNDDLTAIYDDFAAPYAVSKYIRDREYYGRDE